MEETVDKLWCSCKNNYQKKDVAIKDGYKTITEIAEEHIRRASDKSVEENQLLADKLDIGYKVYELSKSNIKKWNAKPKD